MPTPPEREARWRLRLARCALGVGTAVTTGWLSVVLALAAWGILLDLRGQLGDSAHPLGAAYAFGFFGALIAAPIAIGLGAPVWLIADQAGLTRRRSGAVAGALLGVVISLVIPFMLVVLPFVGAFAGFLAVLVTNRCLPWERG